LVQNETTVSNNETKYRNAILKMLYHNLLQEKPIFNTLVAKRKKEKYHPKMR